MTINQAVKELYNYFQCPTNYPNWLSAIGIGEDEIFIYLKGTTYPKPKLDSWQGFPIKYKENCEFLP